MTSAWEQIDVPVESIDETLANQEADISVGGLTLVSNALESEIASTPSQPFPKPDSVTPLVPKKLNEKSRKTKSADGSRQYFDEIGLHPLLSADEERELAQKVEKGLYAMELLGDWKMPYDQARDEIRAQIDEGRAAKTRFIESNLRLVVSIAKRYPLPPSMELLDLVQEGNLGLEHAVDKFDWRKGFKFSTYATFWIRQAIGRALDQRASIVRLPGDRSATLRAALRQAEGDEAKLDEEQARLYRLTTPTSLHRKMGEEDEGELIDLIPDQGIGPEDATMNMFEFEQIEAILATLSEKDERMLKRRFGLDDGEKKSFKTVGEYEGITPEAARRHIKRIVSTVRAAAVILISTADTE